MEILLTHGYALFQRGKGFAMRSGDTVATLRIIRNGSPWELFFFDPNHKDEDNDPMKCSIQKKNNSPTASKQKIDRHLNTTMKVVLVTGGFDPIPWTHFLF